MAQTEKEKRAQELLRIYDEVKKANAERLDEAAVLAEQALHESRELAGWVSDHLLDVFFAAVSPEKDAETIRRALDSIQLQMKSLFGYKEPMQKLVAILENVGEKFLWKEKFEKSRLMRKINERLSKLSFGRKEEASVAGVEAMKEAFLARLEGIYDKFQRAFNLVRDAYNTVVEQTKIMDELYWGERPSPYSLDLKNQVKVRAAAIGANLSTALFLVSDAMALCAERLRRRFAM